MTRLFSVFGDSISTFEGTMPSGWRVYYEGSQLEQTGVRTPADTWWGHVIRHFGGKLLANASWSGSMVEGGFYPAGSSPERIAALGKDGQAPDDILVYIGINDYGWGGVAAQVAAGSAAAPPALVAASSADGTNDAGSSEGNDTGGSASDSSKGVCGNTDGGSAGSNSGKGASNSQTARSCQSSDAQSNRQSSEAGMAPEGAIEAFAASYENMLARMHEAWPQARIWAAALLPGRLKGVAQPTFPRFFRGIAFDAYNNAIRNAAASVPSCRFVNAAALGFDYEAADGTHPTDIGMKQIAALFLHGMRKADPDAAGAFAQPHNAGSEQSSIFSPDGDALAPDDTALALNALFDKSMRSATFCNEPCVGCPHARGTGNTWFHVCERQIKDRG